MKIKTIDVNAKEWRDKVNGNSYFSAVVTLNFGMTGEKSFEIGFQYGYGDHYEDVAFRELQRRKLIKADDRTRLWSYCKDNGIVYRHSKQTGCKKRDL